MLLCGVLVITCRNPVNSAMFLIMVFFFMAGLFVLLQAWFLAAVQVLVYAGAIMVLFLFVIMLLNLAEEEKRKLHLFGMINGALVATLLAFEFCWISSHSRLVPQGAASNRAGTTEAIGRLLFSKYLVPFEIASVLLLAAMIGVIVLSRKESSIAKATEDTPIRGAGKSEGKS